MTVLLPPGSLDGVLARASNGADYERWAEQVRRTGFCAHPVRLSGRAVTVEAACGEVVSRYETAGEPDGTLLVACRNRRATRCPSCAETYRQDSFHLIAAGLRGGKGVPDDVGDHPRVFLTLTAPSFGAVHAARHGQRPCRRRRRSEVCPHGVSRGCWRRHKDGDPLLGQPLCSLCFDYDGAVLWNALAPELWRRTTIVIRRQLARIGGVPVRGLEEHVRLRFTKVVEYQARGSIHLHAVLRLDGAASDRVTRPGPEWTAEMLSQAIQAAVAGVSAPMPGRDPESNIRARWGVQLDVRSLPAGDAETPRESSRSHKHARSVAAYIAKYATKSTDPLGSLDRRLRSGHEIDALNVDEHRRELVETAWQLGGLPHLAGLKLRRWAHTLGYRGHWATRSRRYSTTLGALREVRRNWRRPPIAAGRDVVVVGTWRYCGSGHRNPGDAWLAATAARARQQTRLEARAHYLAAS